MKYTSKKLTTWQLLTIEAALRARLETFQKSDQRHIEKLIEAGILDLVKLIEDCSKITLTTRT